ncbi:hypothetical protein ACHAXR_011794 [Thalassiosira sp. AJA248-18]
MAVATATTSQVRVGVRIRPLTSKETSEGGNAVVDANPFNRTISLSKRQFTYDNVLHSNVTQLDLYNDVAPPLLDAFLGGYNATVIAYGQTGSGKTFTMGSEAHGDLAANLQFSGSLNESDGLIPRFMSDIFTMLMQRKEASEKAVLQSPRNGQKMAPSGGGGADALIDYSLSASFLEVYGEDIHDLLDDDRHSLPIREDSNGEVIVKGLRNTPIASDAEAMHVLNTGTMNRTTAATLMNLTSSRSHAVFTVNLAQTTRSTEDVDITTTSRFTFVDLAGSERMKKTGAEGERAKEGIKINEGLLALGNVINALADEERLARGEKIHVPYRQSKLTRLLQDALGGNSQTLFMACVSPSDTNASETLSTLQYANRARNIKNRPTQNVDATAMELQRLRTLTNLLKCELIKQRFGDSVSVATDPQVERSESSFNPQDIGVMNENLLQREDVVAYMNQIDEKMAELGGSNSNLAMSFPTHSVPSNAAASRQSVLPFSSASAETTGRISIQSSSKVAPSSISDPVKLDEDENTLILDVNPEEDMQIIDQLLEIQQNDQKFQREQNDDQDRLDVMDGEIEAQEGRLLQLRDHLKVYHNMKDKYERLMCEVSSLEAEKQAALDELEKAQVDPTKGCSQAIKKKLQRVEEGLARARSETRKHQQKFRQAEQEAQKAKVLERKIQDLKQAKVTLIRKQREDAAKHKEFTNQKSREIQGLKRREKNADRKISKMEMEAQRYKANMERSRANCEKLSDKLKQTESHLMRLLTKRRNDLNQGTKNTRKSRAHGADLQHHFEKMDQFAPVNEEVKSIKFLLEKTVSDRVTFSQCRDAYESKVVEHGQLMQALAKEAKRLRERRTDYQATDCENTAEITAQIRDHEETVQELQLQIELLETDLEQLRVKCPNLEDRVFDEDGTDENGPVLKMITKLDGPVLRTLIWNLLQSYVSAELQRRNLKVMLDRKESERVCFENEVLAQNEKISALTKSLDRRRQLMTCPEGKEFDPIDTIQDLESQVQATNVKLDSCLAELEDTRSAIALTQVEHAQAEEKLALFHSQQKLTESTEGTEQVLNQLQDVLAVIGMSMEDRETVRIKLENCVEDACSTMLDEAATLRDKKAQQVNYQKDRLAEMYAALGLECKSLDENLHSSPQSLNNQLKSLGHQLNEIQPQYIESEERCNSLASDAETLTSDLGHDLSGSLQELMQNRRLHGAKRKLPGQTPAHHRASMEASREARAKMFKNVEHMMKSLQTIDETSDHDSEGPFALHQDRSSQRINDDESSLMEPGSLSKPFLDSCERDIKRLRLVKSDRLLSNVETCEKVCVITKKMHVGVGTGELSSIVLHGLKKHKRDIPNWWDESVAREVYDALSKKGSTVLVNDAFTNHLSLIFDTLRVISHGRQLLSDTLKDVINDSHSALLATAEGCGMDVTDLSQCLLQSLHHLPPLSKEHVHACIDEMQMLVTAAESVSQSEVETLTVLWEGLNMTSSERGKFWAELNQLMGGVEMTTKSPFDNVLDECPAEVEEWVLKSSKDATRVQRNLGVRVFKLKKIHAEVERLKRKQDAKNGIMSLNNELKLLSAKLSDFEEKASDKQRLLNKKVNSSSLLGEERFRKQMQSMFTTKLESLRQMLNEWEANEGPIEDNDMLSEVSKSMLQNSHRIDAWMKEKTRLMHLRTTNTKSRYRDTPKHERSSTTSTRPSSGPSRSRTNSASNKPGIPQKPNNHISKRVSSADNGQRMGHKNSSQKRSTIAGHRSRPSKSSPPPTLNKSDTASSEHQQRKALSSSTHNAPHQPEQGTKRPSSVEVKESGSQVLLPYGPFGNLLAETPKEKENNNAHF